MTKEAAKKEIEKLVIDYELHRNEYKQKGYDEHQFCMRIINRFFNALGWDVENKHNKSEWYCDTIFQFKLKKKDTTKFPDYAFGFPAKNNAKFFAEAKTPSTILHTDKDAALQIRRYGKSAGLAISVITNFEEFAFYDCTTRAKESDSARVGRLEHFTYKQYSEKFDLLWGLFSKEGIEQGYHDKYVKTDTKKKGSVTLDKDFVATLDSWRKDLATSIAHNNQRLTNDEINFAVQQTIDRIIFLRFCEDRNIEKFETLLATVKKGDYYKNLYEVFTEADIKYNSGLFDFDKDHISHKIKIENKVVKNIIEELYRPRSEYEFGVMPVEILGNAYEEFLGKVIRITPGHNVKIDIERKPEVQKAGGVFYTPQYIVNFIVEHTVGKLINGKTPEQISKIKIVDPACGSGSFLLGAYIYLLRYHTDYYWKKDFHKKREKNHLITTVGQLTVTEKKRILQNNLFGVDIDANAVEVTKLSLLLKAMEGETEASIGQQLRLDKKGVLPDLDNNIQCGNSLISPDFYDEQLNFNTGEKKKINAFDWKAGFPLVFKQGGFDAVIGNPPWGAEFSAEELEYLLNKYTQVATKTKDSYLYFIIKSLRILAADKHLGFIIPNTWLLINNADSFRSFILNHKVNEIRDYGDGVFKTATVESAVLLMENKNQKKGKCRAVKIVKNEVVSNNLIDKSIWQNDSLKRIILQRTDDIDKIVQKTLKHSVLFSSKCEIIWGIKPYQVGHGNPTQTKQMLEKRIYHSTSKKGKDWKPLLVGSDVNRFSISFNNDLFIKYGKNLMYSSDESKMLKTKILLRQTSDKIRASLEDKKLYCQNSVFIVTSNVFDLKYLLGLLNSNLFDFLYKLKNPQKGKVFAEIKPSAIKELPIKLINAKDHSLKSKHDSIIRQVDNLLQLNKDLTKAKLPNDKKSIVNRISSAENKLNEIVYELYGISKKEIELIEK